MMGRLLQERIFFDDLNAVHVRQSQVQQHHIRPVGQGVHQRSRPGLGPVKLIVLGLQRCGDEVAHRRVVLHKKNLRFIHGLSPPLRPG